MTENGITDQQRFFNKFHMQPYDVLSWAAAVSVVYYLFAFGFEVGFFWEPGLEIIPAFSIGEHISHAGAYFIQLAIVVISSMFFLYLQEVVRYYLNGSTRTAEVLEPTTRFGEKPRHIRYLIIAGISPLVILAVYTVSVYIVPAIYRHFGPESVCTLCAVLTFISKMLEDMFDLRTQFWKVYFGLFLVLFGPAVGQFEYDQLIIRGDTTYIHVSENKEFSGLLVFAGLTKTIIRSKEVFCLYDYELKSSTILRVTATRSAPGGAVNCLAGPSRIPEPTAGYIPTKRQPVFDQKRVNGNRSQPKPLP